MIRNVPPAGGTGGLPYDIYSAVLTQVGTANPTVEEFYVAGFPSLVWTRVSIGQFIGTAAGEFDPGAWKFFLSAPNIQYILLLNDESYAYLGFDGSIDHVNLTVLDSGRIPIDSFAGLSVEIRRIAL